MLSVLEQAVQW